MLAHIPRRGDFISLAFDPQAGHEQMGRRAALVVSHTAFNRKMGFVFVCPISNSSRKNSFYVPVSPGEKVTGVVMADQLSSLDYRARKAYFIGKASPDTLLKVLERVEPIIF